MTKYKKYGRYPSTKKEEEEMYQFCKSCFKWTGRFLIVYITLAVIYGLLAPPLPQSAQKRNIIDTCEEAKENLKYALDRRDAVTSSEAMTPEGMERWTLWRDRAVDVESEAVRLCPAGEALLSQSSADN